jgi:Delta7-sterol 5-desaturase
MEVIKEILTQIPKGLAQGFMMNGLIITLVYFIFWKLLAKRFANWRIQINQKADAAQIKSEIKNAVLVLLVGAVFSSVVYFMAGHGYTKVYTNISEHSPWMPFVTFVVILLVDDAWFYFVHRLLHHPKLYKYIHAKHHESIDTTPYTSLSFHWLEPTLTTLWIFPLTMLMPTYLPALAIVQMYGLFDNIKAHLGYEFYPSWFNKSPLAILTTSTHHNMHHHHFNGNYGVHFRFWDKLFGTEFTNYENEFDTIQARKKGIVLSKEKQAVTDTIATVTVNFNGISNVDIQQDETVLQALLRNNIQAPHLCKRGICGTCKCKLLQGQVSMQNRKALSDAEEQDGYILICQSVPVGNQLEIEIEDKKL